MIFGFALIVFGYAIWYWGIHHFSGFDCPGGGNTCRYSLVQLLGLPKGTLSVPDPFKF